jgi:hypothetical protein
MQNAAILVALFTATITGCTFVCPSQPPVAAPATILAAPSPPPLPPLPAVPPAPPAGPPGEHRARQEHGARHLYRFDFVVSGGAEKAGSTSGTYSVALEEDRPGEVHAGANVPLGQNGGGPRQDVGLKIKASYVLSGDDLVLEVDTEQSAQDEGGVIRKLTSRGAAVVSPGKPSTIINVDDAAGKKRLQVNVTVTKLR